MEKYQTIPGSSHTVVTSLRLTWTSEYALSAHHSIYMKMWMESSQARRFRLRDIREQVLERAGQYLKGYLEDNIEAARSRVEKFVSEKAPRYRPIVSRMGEDDLAIDPSISDKDLDLYLHRQLAELEETMRVQGHDIMAMFEGDYDDYKDRLSKYLRTAEDIKKSDLANYVSYRWYHIGYTWKINTKDRFWWLCTGGSNSQSYNANA